MPSFAALKTEVFILPMFQRSNSSSRAFRLNLTLYLLS